MPLCFGALHTSEETQMAIWSQGPHLNVDVHLTVYQCMGSEGLVIMEASIHMSCDIHFSSVNSSLKEALMSHSLLPNWALTLSII